VGGEYYAAYFFTTSNRYNLLGLSFTDDVVGNTAQFSVKNPDVEKNVTLQKKSVTLNGQDPALAAFPLHFAATETVIVKAIVTNPSDQEKKVPLQWNQYAWDSQNADNRRNTKTELLTLAPGETRELSYTVAKQRESVVYVTATVQDGDAKSIFNLRFVHDGIEETRINFPSLTKFPLIAGESQTLFACAHSTNLPIVSGNTLTLTLTDQKNNKIHQYRYEGDISGDMAGFGEVFTPKNNYNYVNLEAKLERNGVVVEKVNIVYDCQKINPDSCYVEPTEETTQVGQSFLKITPFLIGAGILLLILISILIAINIKRSKKGSTAQQKSSDADTGNQKGNAPGEGM
jgi:hypothetical protein